ncbi:hypothetical protein K227x_25200 [Rubripirellula lacrimiformis]|uniref:Uncharacterized protein n=1 Tax=Rubripirellula lacrimiformis TaxID=1930273 RepID=A0A517NAI2_9BACT|nr:hypothetical protein [Rubripirellula lacrimiformis]QDT04132.1 hypothetical protein K227x_25200 [Rubripirellula lacrimiformis]
MMWIRHRVSTALGPDRRTPRAEISNAALPWAKQTSPWNLIAGQLIAGQLIAGFACACHLIACQHGDRHVLAR